ncbi:MAG TPA: hypothetical protein VGG85_19315 [Terracidiphilus sp.]|jgi:hypothetical protein
MAFESEAIRAVFGHFITRQQLVADILAGPRREGWFNAESFVALSAISSPETFTVYGEQCYANIPRCLAGTRIPDLVGYTPDESVAFIIEAKLFFRRDSANQRKKQLRRLVEQMLEAKRQCPSAPAIGLVHLACLSSDPLKKKARGDNVGFRVTADSLCVKLTKEFEAELKAVPSTWLEPLRILTPLLGKKTTFDYPSVHVWFGMGAIAI